MQENLISMIDLDHVQRVRDYGVAGVSRPLSSFFHEQHQFDYQKQPCGKSGLATKNLLKK